MNQITHVQNPKVKTDRTKNRNRQNHYWGY